MSPKAATNGAGNSAGQVDAGTLARTQSPTPGATCSYLSSSEFYLCSEEFLAQSADATLWYCKIAIYVTCGPPRLASDRTSPTPGGVEYTSVRVAFVEVMAIEEYEKLLRQKLLEEPQIMRDALKSYAASRAEYYRKLDSPYPIPGHLKYPEKFPVNWQQGKSVMDDPVKALAKPVGELIDAIVLVLEQKETKFLIDLIFLVVSVYTGSVVGRVLAVGGFLVSLATGEFGGVQGVIIDKAVGKFFASKLFKKVVNLKSKTVLEVSEWGTSQKVGQVVDDLTGGGAVAVSAGETTLQRFLKVQSFRYQLDPAFKKKTDEFWQTFMQKLADMKAKMYNPPTAPQGK